MGVNRVPKFVEHKVAQRRKAAKTSGSSHSISKDKKYSAFDAARRKFEEKQKEVEEKQKEREAREEKRIEHKKERKQEGRLLNKRNARGQPNMNSQLELLMKRFNTQ